MPDKSVVEEPMKARCNGDAGERPWWMSEGQYDPCRCWLRAGHEGPHQCDHTNPEFVDA